MVLEAAKLAYGNKAKESIVLNKHKSATHLLLNGPEMLSSASDKAKLHTVDFSENSNLDD